ncbi:MAG: GIY-YIG nuclease family protein [bacterium]|nr:GIY-YIG nuclease family protein [bacterium]
MAFVYILKDDAGRFYVGSTANLQKRLLRHRQGSTHTTKRMKNPHLVFSQKYESLEIARRIERKIKKLKRRDYIEKMVSGGYIKLTP